MLARQLRGGEALERSGKPLAGDHTEMDCYVRKLHLDMPLIVYLSYLVVWYETSHWVMRVRLKIPVKSTTREKDYLE